jgi:hypothetical protein
MSNFNFLKIFVKKNIGSIIVRLSKKQIARISRNNQTCIFQICNKFENKCKTTGIKWKFSVGFKFTAEVRSQQNAPALGRLFKILLSKTGMGSCGREVPRLLCNFEPRLLQKFQSNHQE